MKPEKIEWCLRDLIKELKAVNDDFFGNIEVKMHFVAGNVAHFNYTVQKSIKNNK